MPRPLAQRREVEPDDVALAGDGADFATLQRKFVAAVAVTARDLLHQRPQLLARSSRAAVEIKGTVLQMAQPVVHRSVDRQHVQFPLQQRYRRQKPRALQTAAVQLARGRIGSDYECGTA